MADVLTPKVWPNGTEVTLYDVPWDSSYRDVVAWESEQKRDEWFASHRGFAFPTKFHWLRPNVPIVVECPYSTAYQFNYLSVRNLANPVISEGPERTLYYFVTDCQPANTGTCTLAIQLDVATTYGCAVGLGNTFVESGHLPQTLINPATFTAEELRRLCTQPEGLELGSEYVTVSKKFFPLNAPKNAPDGSAIQPDIIVVSTADLAADPGTTTEPKLVTAKGSYSEHLISGAAVYVFDNHTFLQAMQLLSVKSWVSQCVISIYAFPGGLIDGGDETTLFGKAGNPKMRVLGDTAHLSVVPGDEFAKVDDVFAELATGMDSRLKKLVKLFAYPYSVIELSAFNGSPIYLKPEQLNGRELRIFLATMALAPMAKIGAFPYPYGSTEGFTTFSYLNFDEVRTGTIGAGEFLDTCLWISDFPSFSIVNNMYYSALAKTANTRLYQYQSAGWGLESSKAAQRTAYNNAQMLQQTAYDAFGRSQDTSRANFAAGQTLGAVNIGVSAGRGVAAGNYAGAAIGLAQGAAGLAVQQGNFNRSMATADANQSAAYQTGRNVADANYELAAYQNQGNYENTIRGIQAAVNDMALTSPATVGQQGGEGLMWKEGLVGVLVTFKTLAPAAMSTVSQFFARYGYKHNEFRFLNRLQEDRNGFYKMAIMKHFTYWKTQGMRIFGDMNDSERMALQGIFNRGVTLWTNPDEIGKISVYSNLED